MSYTLNLDAIKQSLKSKTSAHLLDILAFTQDDYDPAIIPLIEEILIERDIPKENIEDSKNSYTKLKENINSQPPLRNKAGFFIRMCQYIIDHFIFFGICYIIQFELAKVNLLDNSGRYEAYCMGAYLLYYAITIGLFSATIGMSVVGIMVTDYNKKNIDFWTGLLRGIYMMLNYLILQIGHLWMIWDKNKQTLPDKWSKTFVVYRR